MDVSKLSITLDGANDRKIINGQYRIIKKIGEGQFGKVLLGEVIPAKLECRDKWVAIKTINRIDKSRLITRTYMSQTTKIKREIQIMKETNHPNVVQLYQVIDDLKFDKILLILEYCQFGEINWKKYSHYYEKYQTHSDRPRLTINKILRDVCDGLEYLHDCKKIIHRDLKPSNLLINQDNIVKISDFGVSLILENNANDAKELGKTMGTPAFFAPELCQFVHNRYSMITNDQHKNNKIKIDYRIDIWSLGVILYCLIFNDLPFNGFNEYELFKNIVKQELTFPKINKTSKTTENDLQELKLLKDLIKSLLCKDPDARLTITQIKNHPFTIFDLTTLETKKYLSNNQKIINPDQGLSSKIKKLFMGSTPKPVLKPTSPETDPILLHSLEPVDDLLDSYLDDSSSFGSDVEEVDTTDLLKEGNVFLEEKAKIKPPPLNLSSSTFSEPLTLNRDGYGFASPSNKSTNSLPSPQRVLQNSTPRRSPIRSASSSMLSGTPTNNNTITIGASSPSSFRSLFSPSQRFFSRNRLKKQTKATNKPTIDSLKSPIQPNAPMLTPSTSTSNKISDLMEPPPIFGLSVHQPQSNGNLTFSSRKNSMVSGQGLSRITSSSSSLNLHAYLTDDNYSVASVNDRPTENRQSGFSFNSSVMSEEDEETDNDAIDKIDEIDADITSTSIEVQDSTMIINDESEIFKNYTSMSEFLANLD